MIIREYPDSESDQYAVQQDDRWLQIVARDPSADGLFWYSVSSTGIYCRPSCPSRQARPENVRIHDSITHARATGSRPCKRCDPDRAGTPTLTSQLIAQACRTLENAETAPSLSSLAQQAGLSPRQFHHLFRTETGLTPKAYSLACRTNRMRDALTEAQSVTDAIYAAGYQSSGRFYADAPSILGMTAQTYRTGGQGETIYFALGETSLGAILVAITDKGIVAINLGDDPQTLLDALQARFDEATLQPSTDEHAHWIASAIACVEQPSLGCDLPLDIRGTAFQQRVWQALRSIPAGATLNYTQLAEAIGQPSAARAVASACAANSLAVAIPCHRIVRSDGSLSGYRWGVARKKALLEKERL